MLFGVFFSPLLRHISDALIKTERLFRSSSELKSCKGSKLQKNNPLLPSNIEWSSSCLLSLTTKLRVLYINKGLSQEWKVEVEMNIQKGCTNFSFVSQFLSYICVDQFTELESPPPLLNMHLNTLLNQLVKTAFDLLCSWKGFWFLKHICWCTRTRFKIRTGLLKFPISHYS